VDKVRDAKRFDASMLRRFGLQRLKLSRRNVVVKEAMLFETILLQELIDTEAQALGLIRCRFGVEDEDPFGRDRGL
jgi:hypothetical protein